MASVADEHRWRLYADWCAATGHPPLPTDPATVLAFLRACPAAPATQAARIREINRRAQAEGHPPLPATPELDRLARRTTRQDHEQPCRFNSTQVETVLTALPVRGWPEGLVGRRDALLLHLIARDGWTRRQVLSLRLSDLTLDAGEGTAKITLRGSAERPVERAGEPSRCPACIAARWARAARLAANAGRNATREQLAAMPVSPASLEARHDCTRPLPLLKQDGPLFPAIDKHGWPAPQALTRRAVTAIVQGRLAHEHVDVGIAADLLDAADWEQPALQPARDEETQPLAPLTPEAAIEAKHHGRQVMRDVAALLDELDMLLDAHRAEIDTVLANGARLDVDLHATTQKDA